MDDAIRADFPVLSRRIEDRPVVYLDSAATALKPQVMIDAVAGYYSQQSANVHRGKHTLSEEASEAFEDARRTVARFIGGGAREIVLTAGTTHAINLVALGLGFRPGDNVVTDLQEHHSNLVPWFQNARVKVCPVGEDGRVDPERMLGLIDDNTRLVAVGHASNATGAVQDVEAIVSGAKAKGVRVLVDGAQATPHMAVDVKKLGCDFYTFSGHKVCGPTGIGALWATRDAYEHLGTALGGGGMVDVVTSEGYSPKAIPFRFEPGTPNIAGAIGLDASLRYIRKIGWARIEEHEAKLADKLVEGLSDIAGTRLLGPARGERRLPLVSLVIDSDTLAPDHVAMMLSDTHKVMVRSGHHCCHPYFDGLGTTGSLRVSAHFYNSVEEIEFATQVLRETLGTIHA
jgi:cysteine desulfurase/selenocysteine lyase